MWSWFWFWARGITSQTPEASAVIGPQPSATVADLTPSVILSAERATASIA